MKREGRQHGMVRTYPILPSPMNPSAADDSPPPPTAGVFTKVSRKPTNHSKFTGKCRVPRCEECHVHPCAKSKDKAKGTHKSRSQSRDVVANHMMWSVTGGGRHMLGPNNAFSTMTASAISEYLVANKGYNIDDDDNDMWY